MGRVREIVLISIVIVVEGVVLVDILVILSPSEKCQRSCQAHLIDQMQRLLCDALLSDHSAQLTLVMLLRPQISESDREHNNKGMWTS